MDFFRRKLIFMELTGMGQFHVIWMHKMLSLLMSPLLSPLVDAIASIAIFNQLQERSNWDRPNSSFGADIYTELVAFITENVME